MSNSKGMMLKIKLILMITTTVFSFSSMSNAFYLMGFAALPWYLVAAFFFFIPYVLIISEYTATYKEQSGGLYVWLKDSLSEKGAFVATFLWYSSYLIWMVSLFLKLWLPFSFFLFGQDQTQSTKLVFGLPMSSFLGILSVIAMIVLTYIVNKGFRKVASMMLLGGIFITVLLVVALIGNSFLLIQRGGQFLEPLSVQQFLSAPSPEYQGVLGNLSFFIFGITAFGGLDTVASMVDQMKLKGKIFSKAIVISSFLIIGFYLIGIFLWASSTNIRHFLVENHVNMGNAMYLLMGNLGAQLGGSLHLAKSQTYLLSQILIRLTGMALFSTYIGLLASMIYSPLKAFILSLSGELGPFKKVHVSSKALWLQATAIVMFILVVTFGGTAISSLYNRLTLMTNVSRSIPYLIVAFSFPSFKKLTTVNRTFEVLNTKKSIYCASRSVMVCISLSILFTVTAPFFKGDYESVFFLLFGPVFFILLSSSLYRWKKLTSKKLVDEHR